MHGFVVRMGADVARREEFLERWAGRHKGNEAVLFDTTSVSSHSPSLDAHVLDELGKAKALVTRKRDRILLEVSKKQRELLAALKVPEMA